MAPGTIPEVQVVIFHGYLLRGTGSNVYNAKLGEALARAGHEVHLLCQEPDPLSLGWVDAVGTWTDGALDVSVAREPVRATAYRPAIGRLLPVYVADRYEGFDARPLPECTDEEVGAYVAANAAALRDVCARLDGGAPDAVLANHLVLGPAIVARAGLSGAVKVHGSALEYIVKPYFGRFGPWAREGLAAARTVLVGSRHTAESLWAAMGDDALPDRTRLGPPGVDVEQFAPREDAAARLAALAGRLAATEAAEETSDAFALDHAAAGEALAGLDPARDRLVAFVGKLIVSKGVDLLVAAWPLVLAAAPEAKLVVVGFGAYREGLESLARALASGDVEAARELVRRGRAVEGGPEAPLAILGAFLGRVDDGYLEGARGLEERIVWVGRLEHAELAEVIPACEAQVVPSTFPEAFGMVAAEAAACGVLPVSAAHSGLAEVSRILADAVGEDVAPLLSFDVGPRAIEDLAERIVAWLRTPETVRAPARDALVATARERFSWDGVADGVLAAAAGRLDELAPPA